MKARRRMLAGWLVPLVALTGLLALDGSPATAASGTVTNATFEWRFSDEANAAAFNGQCNFWSAGRSDGSAATYGATNGNATVLKADSAGVDVPISGYANRCLNGLGQAPNTVNGTGARRLGQKVRFTGGIGTVDPATGASTIQWSGAFSVNFYGTLVPFWIDNPKLTVTSGGVGTLTATVGGYASDQANPDVRVQLPDRPNVVIARLPVVAGANPTGFTATPAYPGVLYDVDPASGQSPQNRTTAGWGAWPTSFVDYQMQTGLGSYWYSSGGSADARKAPYPVTVRYGTIASLPTVAAADCATKEARSCNFAVSLSKASSTPVTVRYATQTGTAGTADYTAKSGTLTFPAGSTSQSVGVKLTDDDRTEPNETFTLALSSPAGAVLGRNATGTVRDGTLVVTASFGTADADQIAQAAAYYTQSADPLRFGARIVRLVDALTEGGLDPVSPVPTSSGPVTLTARYSQEEAAVMTALAARLGLPMQALHIQGARFMRFFWTIETQ